MTELVSHGEWKSENFTPEQTQAFLSSESRIAFNEDIAFFIQKKGTEPFVALFNWFQEFALRQKRWEEQWKIFLSSETQRGLLINDIDNNANRIFLS